ncbi:MAG: response regulator [Nitrospiraceae bacterium]|nr:response regulator [Nitrospiraceae bacterium]
MNIGTNKLNRGTRLNSFTSKIAHVFFDSFKTALLTILFVSILFFLSFLLWHQIVDSKKISQPVITDQDNGLKVANNTSKDVRQILVLDSYNIGYSWSDNEIQGIIETFKKADPKLRLFIEYLDFKNFPGMGYADRLKDIFLKKYRTKNFPVVIAADNPALEFVLKYRPALFPNAAIVFCGINGFDEKMIKGYKNITGVAEVLDAEGSVRAALSMFPKTQEVIVIHDYSVTGLATRAEAEKQLKALYDKVKFSYAENMSIQELIRYLKGISSNSIVLALSYGMDGDGQVFNHSTISRLLSANSPVPVFSVHEERLGYGTIGGSLLGGKLHGELAAEMALRILSGEPASNIPIDFKSPARKMFDYNQLVRFNIPLESLPEKSIIINKPISFFEEYRSLALTVLGIIITLIIGIIILGVNIYERKIAEQALLEQQSFTGKLIKNSTVATFVLDNKHRVMLWNKACEELTGCMESDMVNTDDQWKPFYSNKRSTLADVIIDNNLDSLSKLYANYSKSALNPNGIKAEGWYKDLGGKDRYIVFESSPIYNKKGELTAAIETIHDITESKRLGEQLLQAQKIEAIGQLAGGVAHDFNNILTAIVGYAYLTLMKMPGDNLLKGNIEQILNASERAKKLTQSLLSFSRKQIINPEPINLNEIVKKLEDFLHRLLREDIKISMKFDEDDLIVFADSGQIEQMLMNLVANAGDAMPNGGLIDISTKLVNLDNKFIEAYGYGKEGQYALVSVSDTGEGMDEKTKRRIFEPFFTTKAQGKGTGLGLSVVYGIVKQNNGFINVYSEQGKGTQFNIYMPLCGVIKGERQTKNECEQIKGGTETILVAEDDAVLLRLASTVLSNNGYKVIEAEDGEEAIAKYSTNKDIIKLIILDGIMPNKNGREAYQGIKVITPNIKTIFMSGYAEDIISKGGLLEPGIKFMLKPVTPLDLLKKVREVLDA